MTVVFYNNSTKSQEIHEEIDFLFQTRNSQEN